MYLQFLVRTKIGCLRFRGIGCLGYSHLLSMKKLDGTVPSSRFPWISPEFAYQFDNWNLHSDRVLALATDHADTKVGNPSSRQSDLCGHSQAEEGWTSRIYELCERVSGQVHPKKTQHDLTYSCLLPARHSLPCRWPGKTAHWLCPHRHPSQGCLWSLLNWWLSSGVEYQERHRKEVLETWNNCINKSKTFIDPRNMFVVQALVFKGYCGHAFFFAAMVLWNLCTRPLLCAIVQTRAQGCSGRSDSCLCGFSTCTWNRSQSSSHCSCCHRCGWCFCICNCLCHCLGRGGRRVACRHGSGCQCCRSQCFCSGCRC